MKDKYKIEIEHKKKIQNLKKHNKYYFIDDSPKINILILKKIILLTKLSVLHLQINLKKLNI